MSNVNTQSQKKSLFLIQVGRSNPIGTEYSGQLFNAVLVYSFLVYRLTMEKGQWHAATCTRAAIHRGTGLDVNRAIPAAIIILKKFKLAGEYENRIYAIKPTDLDWFVLKEDSEKRSWFKRFAYTKLWIPRTDISPRLMTRHNALYWLIKRKPAQAQKWYALVLGITEVTCRNGIARLRGFNLLSSTELRVVTPNEEQLALWQDSRKRKPKEKNDRWRFSDYCDWFMDLCWFEDSDADGEFVSSEQQFVRSMGQYQELMKQAGYSSKEMMEYWSECLAGKEMLFVELFLHQGFIPVFELAESETRQNQRTGKFHGRNSLGFLKKYTASALLQIEELHQRNADMLFAWEFQKGDD